MEFLIFILIIMSIYFVFSIRSLKGNIRLQNRKIIELQNEMEDFKESRILAESVDKELVDENETTNQNTSSKKADVKDVTAKSKMIDKIKTTSHDITDKKKKLFSVESIITKLGILLLLIGVGFIFKFSYDSGILTERVVLIIGVIFGIALMSIGEVVRKRKREVLSQVLFGGGVATLFITTYSAYQVYGFITSSTAFIIMSLLTLVTFLVAVHLDSMVMSIIGLLGGLLTPFFVDLKFLGIYGLGLYMIFLSIASMIIYVYKKWRALQVSVICGIFLITSYLITLPSGDISQSYQLAGLIFVLYVIFNGVEYGLTYLNKNRNFDKVVKPLLIGILPIITIAELTQILDISNTKWSLICLAFSVLHLILWEMLFRKTDYSIITDILLALASLFLLFACALYFDGAILGMSIIALSLLLSFIGEKRQHKYSKIGGYIIFVIGFISAFVNMKSDMFVYEYTWFNLIGHFAVLILLITATLIQKGKIKMVYGILSLELYTIVFIEAIVWQLTKSHDIMSASLMITYGVCIALISIFNKVKNVVPKLSIVILALLPIAFKLLWSLFMLWSMEFELYDFIGFIIYSVIIYAISIAKTFEWKTTEKLLLKLSAFVVLMMTILVDIYILMDSFAYGLLIIGAINLIMFYFEPDKNVKSIAMLNKIFNIAWISFMTLYSLSGFYRAEFDPLLLLIDGALLLVLYFVFKVLNIKREIRFVAHWLLYIMLVSHNFATLEFGSATTTLLWAAYSIANLTLAVKKSEKSMANIALLMIVFVAGKFVIVDLSTASILWKIITSMIFGSALLVISYVLGPIFAKKEESDEFKDE